MNLKDLYRSYVLETIETLVSKGGEKVPDALAQRRLVEGCTNGCDYYVDVHPLHGITSKGCKECGCVCSIKAKFKNHRDPISLKIIETKCPKQIWDKIDNDFFNLKFK